MQNFITALTKRSSIACITRERYGKVDLEFPEFDQALDFATHINRLVGGEIVWPKIDPNDTQAWKRHENLKQLAEIFAEYLSSDFQVISMIAVEDGESDHIEWRNRISWEFENAAKAADLFQRLMWLLE